MDGEETGGDDKVLPANASSAIKGEDSNVDESEYLALLREMH